MHPEFIQLGGFTIHSYGVMMAIALTAAVVVWHILGRLSGKDSGFGADVGLCLMVSGLVGARIAYVIAMYNTHYRYNHWEIIRIDQGGLIYYGGIIGSTIGMWIYAIYRHEPKAALADLVITPIPLAHALGRVGCFLNGCCFGTIYNGPLHVYMQDANRHPVQLYEAGLNLVLFVVLYRAYRRRTRNGVIFASYLIAYPVIRFLTEFLRGDSRAMVGPLTTAQVVSLVLIAVGVVLFVRAKPRTESATG